MTKLEQAKRILRRPAILTVRKSFSKVPGRVNQVLFRCLWAFAQKDTAMAEFLTHHGSPVDVRSAEGATPLITEVQSGEIEKISFLLDHGADVNAVDLRGFSSLHRVAEIGNVKLTRFLLDRGAHPDVAAQGLTPLSLAEKHGHAEVVKLLANKKPI